MIKLKYFNGRFFFMEKDKEVPKDKALELGFTMDSDLFGKLTVKGGINRVKYENKRLKRKLQSR